MSSLGKRLVRSLLEHRTPEVLAEHGISAMDLKDDAREAYSWVLGYYEAHGSYPTPKMLEESTGIGLPEEPDPLAYICDHVRRRSLSMSLGEILPKAAVALDDSDPDTAVRLLRERLGSLAAVGKKGLFSFRESGKARTAFYAEVKKTGGLLGMRTPWPTLDSHILGWVNGSLHVVAAMLKTGKTWFSCIIAEDALRRGLKVLFITLEMSGERIGRRVASVRYRIPWREMVRAEMDSLSEAAWAKAAEADTEGTGDIVIADKHRVRTVADALALAQSLSPDIVVVDGGYRFQPSGKTGGNWESTVDIVAALQHAAEATDVPWVVTTQMGDSKTSGGEKKEGRKMRAWGVRYGKEWVINPDVVIGLSQTELERMDKVMEVHFMAERDPVGDLSKPFFRLNWNFETMDFTEKKVEEEEGEEKTEIGVAF